MMKRTCLILMFSLLFFAGLHAVPAQRKWITAQQRDGSTVTVMLQGDENRHFFVATDGVVLAKALDGSFVYADCGTKGIMPTHVLAHNVGERTSRELSFIKSLATPSLLPRRIVRPNTSFSGGQSEKLGSRKGLIILVQFKDVKFSRVDIKNVFDSIANYRGYHKGKYQGSVRDYFIEQSRGKFDFSFDVVGPVTMSNNESYYGGNSGFGGDAAVDKMIVEACNAVDDSVDFRKYDSDGNGEADQVFVVYAGYGEAQYGPDWTIWPCEGKLESFYDTDEKHDGIRINTFACACELHGNKGKQIDGIGTMCHEFTHCFGIPDFYNTSNSSDYNMDAWDLMNQGAYNHGSYCPAGYTSYERWFCGWLSPIELKDSASISNMKALSTDGDAYIVYNDAYKDEYYLLENRQLTGFDSWLYGKGLLVIHVDYNKEDWGANTVNVDSKHPRMAVIPADNIKTYESVSTDTYPYTFMNGTMVLDSLTDKSIPVAALFHENINGSMFMGKPINSVRQNADSTISFLFGKSSMMDNIKPLYAEEQNIEVFDLFGRVLKGITNKQSLQSLPSGIYIIRQGNGKTYKIRKC